MTRAYAQIAHDIWNDDDWLNLTPGAQHLYVVLVTHPAMSYAGVVDWRPGRLMQRSKGWTPDMFYAAAYELADAFYIVVDTSTEEVMVRSFLRNDTVLSQPRLGVSVTKAYGSIASRKIRQALVFELNRLHHERPELKCWDDSRMQNVLSQQAVDSRTQSPDFEVDPGVTFGVGLGQTFPSVSGSHTTATATSTTNKQHRAGMIPEPVSVDGGNW